MLDQYIYSTCTYMYLSNNDAKQIPESAYMYT